MKLMVNSLKFPHKVHITDDAPWLEVIARDLCPTAPDNARIHGDLTLHNDTAGFIHVKGHISADATLPCDRCGKDVHIPLESDLSATFRPAFAETAPREMSLSAEDLEVYFIEEGAIDLEMLVNDSLQCALPGKVLCELSQGDSCGMEADGPVYQDTKEFERESPFAVLKNLKKS